MADANVHLEIGPQYVEAAREAVEKAVAPFRNAAGYQITPHSNSWGDAWITVEHTACGAQFADTYSRDNAAYGTDTGLSVDKLLKLIAEHHCEVPDA